MGGKGARGSVDLEFAIEPLSSIPSRIKVTTEEPGYPDLDYLHLLLDDLARDYSETASTVAEYKKFYAPPQLPLLAGGEQPAPTSGAGKTGIEFTLPSARAADILSEAAMRAHVALRMVSENEMRLETFGIPARCLLEAGEHGKTRVLIDDIFLQTGMGYDTWKFFVMMCKELGASAAPITPTLPTINAGEGQGEKESAKGIPAVQHLEWLRQNIVSHFNEGELRDLYFGMGIDYDDLPGQSKKDKARELIAYCQRYSRLDDLVAKLRELHPTASWEGEHE
jgi:hypothetical protein